ncbi:putative reverse transcriptase domain-containing protein [Tanacetum coccineum]
MPPRMRTRSAGRPDAKTLGGGTGVRVGRGGRGRRPREGNDERVDDLNGQGNDQGMGANGGVEGVNGNVEGANGGAPDFSTIIAQQLQNLLPAMLAQVSNQGNVGNQNGNVVNENVQENVGNVIVNGNRVGCSYKEFLACNPKEYDGKGGVVVLTRWIEKMESVHDMSGCSIDQKVKYTAGSFVGKALTREEFCPSHEDLKLELSCGYHACWACHVALYNWFHVLAVIVGMVAANKAKTMRRLCKFWCDYTDEEERIRVLSPSVPPAIPTMHPEGRVAYASTVTTRVIWQGIVELVLGRIGHKDRERENRPNKVAAIIGGQGNGIQGNRARVGFMLEIEGHVFDIDLIPFGHGSFDVIIGMDWLSNYKAEIICHEKVVRIPLADGKVLSVLGERLEDKERLLMSAKANDKKQEEIVVVRDFPEVFPDDLSGLPPIREIEFQIKLIPGATPVAKYPYRLAPSELEELPGQLKEL